jgi:hypothetical protein
LTANVCKLLSAEHQSQKKSLQWKWPRTEVNSLFFSHLPCEGHQLRVQRNGQQEVVRYQQTHGECSSEDSNLPVLRHGEGKSKHHADHGEAEGEGELEALDDVANGLEEGDVIDFLGCCAPLHVDAEHVAQQSLRNVQRHTTEEDCDERDPLEVCPETLEEAHLTDAVAQHSQREVSESCEHNDDGEVDLERINVVVVQRAVEEADDEVVQHRENPSRAQGVISSNVGQNRQLGGQRNVGHDESAKQLREGALEYPVLEGVEDEFVATVSVSIDVSTGMMIRGE